MLVLYLVRFKDTALGPAPLSPCCMIFLVVACRFYAIVKVICGNTFMACNANNCGVFHQNATFVIFDQYPREYDNMGRNESLEEMVNVKYYTTLSKVFLHH